MVLLNGEREAALGDELVVRDAARLRLAEGDGATELEDAALYHELVARSRGRDKGDVHVDGGVRVVASHLLAAEAAQRDGSGGVHDGRHYAAVHDAVRVGVALLEDK